MGTVHALFDNPDDLPDGEDFVCTPRPGDANAPRVPAEFRAGPRDPCIVAEFGHPSQPHFYGWTLRARDCHETRNPRWWRDHLGPVSLRLWEHARGDHAAGLPRTLLATVEPSGAAALRPETPERIRVRTPDGREVRAAHVDGVTYSVLLIDWEVDDG